MSIISKLREIGFNQKEISIYLTLLKQGRMTPTMLSRVTKVNRATVYSTAKSLQSKGVVAEDISGKTLYLTALPAQNLGHLFESQKRELQKKEKIIKETINELSLIAAEKIYTVPKIRFIQENDLESFLFSSTVRWQKSALEKDGIWWGFQDHSFVEHFEEWIHSTWETKESKDPRYKGQVISNVSDIEQKLEKVYSKNKRYIKTLPDMNFTSTIWIAGDYLIMIMTKEHPFYLFEVHDKTLAHNMRELVKKLWEST